MTEAESALERQLSRELMSGASPKRRKVEPGDTLVEQGDTGDELYLLLDGVLTVEVDGEEVVELGPGAIVGEVARSEAAREPRRCVHVRRVVSAWCLPTPSTAPKLEQLAAGRRR